MEEADTDEADTEGQQIPQGSRTGGKAVGSTPGGNGNLKGALEALDEKYAATEAPAQEGPVPDGRYNVEIERVILTRSSGGAPMLEYTLVIISEGAHRNRKVWYHRTITENTLKWVKAELTVCGLQLERISDVAEHLPGLAHAKLDITIRTKGEHRNIYFNRRIDVPGDGSNVIEGGSDFPV